tara:strand:+ start:909 stop:1040 length:132 start_codon:yes stop_codon:yes gene_type:complete
MLGMQISSLIKTNYKKNAEFCAIISKLCRHLAKNFCRFRIGAG